MHPDNLLLQKHGTSRASRRLNKTSMKNQYTNPFNEICTPEITITKNFINDHEIKLNGKLIQANNCDFHSLMSKVIDDSRDIIPISPKHKTNRKKLASKELMMTTVDDESLQSICSEDSDLSVGQECCDSNIDIEKNNYIKKLSELKCINAKGFLNVKTNKIKTDVISNINHSNKNYENYGNINSNSNKYNNKNSDSNTHNINKNNKTKSLERYNSVNVNSFSNVKCNNFVSEDDNDSILSSEISDNCEGATNVSAFLDYDRIYQQESVLIAEIPLSEELSNDSNLSVVSHSGIKKRQQQKEKHFIQQDENSNIQSIGKFPFINSFANDLRIPVVSSIAKSHQSRIEEDLLLQSQIYAGELVKQQMQIMAARASAFSQLRNSASASAYTNTTMLLHMNNDVQERGLITQIKETSNNSNDKKPLTMFTEESTNLAGVQSQLQTISKRNISEKIFSNTALNKSTAIGISSSPSFSKIDLNQIDRNLTSCSLTSLNQHRVDLQHLPRIHSFFNTIPHDSNLKFSIDNILKADFGRRILNKCSEDSSLAGNNLDMKNCTKSSDNSKNKSDSSNYQIHSSLSVSSSCSSESSSTVNITEKNNKPKNSIIKSFESMSNSNGINSSIEFNSKINVKPSMSSESSESSPIVWPAWVYCTRYSDRPSSGPRTKKSKKTPVEKGVSVPIPEDKRPRTAFSGPQLARLKHEFAENRYLTEKRRQQLSAELGLNEAQIKIWFQNKRAKIKKSSGSKNPLALQLMAQGLYNHSTVPLTREEEELQELQQSQKHV